jgi:hypothetical protein
MASRTDIAKVLEDIISKTPNTVELHPLLAAFAEVAHELRMKDLVDEQA